MLGSLLALRPRDHLEAVRRAHRAHPSPPVCPVPVLGKPTVHVLCPVLCLRRQVASAGCPCILERSSGPSQLSPWEPRLVAAGTSPEAGIYLGYLLSCHSARRPLREPARLVSLFSTDVSFFFLHKLKVRGCPAHSKATGTVSPTASAHFVSLRSALVIFIACQTSLLLYLFIMVICDR